MIRVTNLQTKQQKFFLSFESMLSDIESEYNSFDCSRLPNSADLSKFDSVIIDNFIFEEIKAI